jgi:general secretion pathway protein G
MRRWPGQSAENTGLSTISTRFFTRYLSLNRSTLRPLPTLGRSVPHPRLLGASASVYQGLSAMFLPARTASSFPARLIAARGFTLIEIMVVITILGILAALVVPKIFGRTDDARITAAKTEISTLVQALKFYRIDNGRFPTTEQGLAALLTKPTIEPIPNNWKQGGYLERTTVPKDPWGKEYQFLSPGVRGEFDVFSFGRDGQSGGEGPDADIGNWQQ